MLRRIDPPPSRARVWRWLLGSLAVVLVIAGVAAAAFLYSVAHAFDSTRHTVQDAFPAVRAPKATGSAAHAVNILLLGQDVDKVDPETPQFEGKQEADTLMLIHIPADRKHVYVMSMLRNSLVPVPGHGEQAINSALAFGGVPLQVQTVEQLLGVRVDHVVGLSLGGMKDLTNALGGVTVRNRTAFSSDGFSFRAGSQRLNGDEALAYVRRGSNSADGDAARAEAQTTYFKAVLEDLLRAKTLLDPRALLTVVSVVSPYLTVDKAFDSAYVADLGLNLRNIRAGDVATFSLRAPTVARIGRATVLRIDPAALAAVRQHLKTDTLDAYVP